MPYIGQAPAPKVVTSSDLADDIVTADKIGDTAISGFSALGATPADTDELLVSDAGTLKRVDFSHLKGGGKHTLLHTVTASSSSSIEFNNTYITSTYRDYHFTFSNVHVATDNVRLELYLSTDNASSYETGNYHTCHFGNRADASSVAVSSTTSGSRIDLTPDHMGNAGGETTSGFFTIFNPLATDNYKAIIGRAMFHETHAVYRNLVLGASYQGSTSAINAVKFSASSGNIDSGVFKIYGVT